MKYGIRFPKPRPLGVSALCLSALGLAAGILRKEPALALFGTVFAVSLAYSYLLVFLLSLIYRKKTAALLVRMIPEKVNVHKNGTACLSRPAYFFEPPAVLIRYKLMLATKDDKKIEYVFDGGFFKNLTADFPAARRGAYYGPHDELVIQDIFGFFYGALKLPQDGGERFLALPLPSEIVPSIQCLTGGYGRRNETHVQKTDDLTEQRPYIPGDDPRRINWKLYSHAGELFVRQEDREPPPHSRFILLIDTDAGTGLYPAGAGPDAIDSLCSAALALLEEKTSTGSEVLFGFTGGGIESGGAAQLSTMLARPARTIPGDKELPALSGFPEMRSVVILALAQGAGCENSALYKFAAKRPPSQAIQIIFFYGNEILKNHAEASAILFNRIPGVKAVTASSPPPP
ncbi:MAG: DUF58 domain-containing protein [Spirochaetaceae bacterium]|jgi:uncharacterized protein (DUF58 family)|nr:DUF58 domain-containing protein [Spirochaetaceae bacterium]